MTSPYRHLVLPLTMLVLGVIGPTSVIIYAASLLLNGAPVSDPYTATH